jgi:hypothetical protein
MWDNNHQNCNQHATGDHKTFVCYGFFPFHGNKKFVYLQNKNTG